MFGQKNTLGMNWSAVDTRGGYRYKICLLDINWYARETVGARGGQADRTSDQVSFDTRTSLERGHAECYLSSIQLYTPVYCKVYNIMFTTNGRDIAVVRYTL